MTDPAPIADFDLAKIAGETARHYGTMRFGMFTVFSAVLGALVSFAVSEAGSYFLVTRLNRVGLACVGFTLSALFAMTEFRVSTLVSVYQEAAYAAKALVEPPAHDVWKHVITLTMVAPYECSAAFWALLAFGVVALPAWPSR